MSRRANASIPIAEQGDHDDRDEATRPVGLAGQREVVSRPAPPGEVGERRQLRDRRPGSR